MITCPMCKKALEDAVQHCNRCGTDVRLLADYRGQCQEGLSKAAGLTRDGQLGEAVWAYLEVLEVDPENPAARQQIGKVVTAVRQFDRARGKRRWLERWRNRKRKIPQWRPGREKISWRSMIAILLFMALCFVAGYHFGFQAGQETGVRGQESR